MYIESVSYCRVIIKLRDGLKPIPGISISLNDFFFKSRILPWRKLSTLFPKIKISRLFKTPTITQILKWINYARKSDPGYSPPDFLAYFVIDIPGKSCVESIVKLLRLCVNVELVYVQNGAIMPPAAFYPYKLTDLQGYLYPAPLGIDAKFSFKIKGGKGSENVKFIDIEQGWILNHSDLAVNLLPATGINNLHFKDHGAAVLGVISMLGKNAKGIVPRTKPYVISLWRKDGTLNPADAIMSALGYLKFGDVLLLEIQTLESTSKKRYVPIEIHEAVYQAIRLATALGIIVIEAAGNGQLNNGEGLDLGSVKISGKKVLLPGHPDFKDSGAIIVSAASSTVPHQKMNFSNYGNRIDCFAWGENVLTAGNYPGSSSMFSEQYTDQFGGTSSAAAIVSGAAIAIQSIVEKNFNYRLGPKQMRELLNSDEFGTGSANGREKDKIGVMPDLKKIIRHLMNSKGNF